MLCSGLWAFGRPLLSQALWWWFAKSRLSPAPSSHHHKSNQTGVFPRNAFLLYDLNNSVPELLTHVVTLLCIECVSDISVSVCSIWYTVFIVYISVIIMLIFSYVSYHVALALLRRRDWRLSCWYSIGLMFSTLLRSFGYVWFYDIVVVLTLRWLSGGRPEMLMLLIWHIPVKWHKTSASRSGFSVQES